MKHVSILTLYDATLTSIDSSHQIFTRVNDFMSYQGRPSFYEVELVGLHSDMNLGGGRYNIRADKTIDDISKTDVVVLPLLCGDFGAAIDRNRKYRDWLIAQYEQHAEVVCLCVGSFFLASTGLLNNKRCAVHWAARNEFEIRFPEVQIVDDNIITDENGMYTCGGGYSYLNLLLYVLEKHLGRDIAILASKMFEIDLDRKTQNPFTIFIGQKAHGDSVVLKAQELIESSPASNFMVDEVCNAVGIGRRTFERRFKKCTGNSVVEYVQRVKVEYAKKLLEGGSKTINEVTYATGYNDVDAFRKVFKRFTDLSPLGYRKKYAM
ncbi:helix-turn-helix domain-containing protein [Chryseolinea sp. T2]|uniref:GlxA family transcriptional regulator n=1 Tax=Chryseolinea sp. T2 TaxID=3129255 RepID=UPI0030780109